MLRSKVCVWITLLVLSAGSVVQAGQQENAALDPATVPAANAPPPTSDSKSVKKGKLADYEETIKPMVKVGKEPSPLFVLWQPGKEAIEEGMDPERLLCEVPSGMLKKPFVISTSLAGGTDLTGFPLDEGIFEWQLRGDQLVLIQPQQFYIVNKESKVGDAVARTHRDTIRGSVDVIAKSKDGSPVFDMGKWLKTNFADVQWLSASPAAQINAGLSTWEKVQAFPLTGNETEV